MSPSCVDGAYCRAVDPDHHRSGAHEGADALALSILSHLLNAPLSTLVSSVDRLEGSLDPGAPEPRALLERACEILDDARIGLSRVQAVTDALLSALTPPRRAEGSTDASGKVLVVTRDVTAAAAVCGALHGQRVTVCDDVSCALQAVERAEPVEVIFCDASVAVVWLLMRTARQDPPVRFVFMVTGGSDPGMSRFLEGRAPLLSAPASEVERIRELARGH